MVSAKFSDRQRSAGGVPVTEADGVPESYRFCQPAMLHFGNPKTEYVAAREDAVVFDVSDRAQIEMTGSDARKFLNNFCTNDINRLAAGEGCEAFVTDVKGRVLAHVFVFVSNDAVSIDATPGSEASLLSHFDRHLFREDVRTNSRTDEHGELLVAGERVGARLASCGIDADGLELLDHRRVERLGYGILVRRVDWFARPAFLLSVDRARLGDLWGELVDATIRPAGAAAFHAVRIEAGFPLFGLDVSERNLAHEVARTHLAISFAKGCYLGQEPIARIDSLGHVNRELFRFALNSEEPPGAGAVVRSADGRDVGQITSSASVPGQGRSVALGYVRRRDTAWESAFAVCMNDGEINARGFRCAATVTVP